MSNVIIDDESCYEHQSADPSYALQGEATYYVTVQARNTSGLRSVDSVSKPIAGGIATDSTLKVYPPLEPITPRRPSL